MLRSGAADDYINAGVAKAWFSLAHSIQVLPATDDELRGLYSRTMSASGRQGRAVYDSIFNASGTCPMCGQGKVFTLDHYLPKSRYAHFAVLPANLVPCCRDCNFAKREQFPSSADEQTFHPYFENLDTDRWLYCQVTVVGGVSLDFYINPPAGWAASQGARAERHFQVFKLREAFATYAATELSTAKFRLQTLFASGGAALVKDDLTLEAVSSGQAHLNSWKTAAYEALAQSDEFCDGGFENIAA
jgi:hypothetical protein